jgi:small subunit ribosomal protein S2
MAAVVSMKQLLEAGVHFGHQTRRWNPKMRRFIFGERNGIYIIDLNQTLRRIETAYTFVRDMVADGGTILFVGTKKQTQDPISSFAERCGMPFVNERWLGGMLTNFSTIHARVQKMQDYERMRAAGDFEAMPKKEALILSRELEKLQRNLGGIRNMARQPDALFVIDTKKEHIAVTEANKLGIPIVAVVDTNCDPDVIDYVIPGNDDAIRSGSLMCRVVAEAVEEGRIMASHRSPAPGAAAPTPPSPEEEARRAELQRDARRQAAAEAQARAARMAAAASPTGLDDNTLDDASAVPGETLPGDAAAASSADTPEATDAPDADSTDATDTTDATDGDATATPAPEAADADAAPAETTSSTSSENQE